MSKVQTIKMEDIVLDSSIYPRSSIDHKRVSMFEENMRDGFEFDPIHLQEHPDERPEIEPYFWDKANLKWPVNGKTKPDLIIFDPPYFSKKAKEYE